MTGRISGADGVAGEIFVWLTDGECWKSTTHAFGEAHVTAAREFFTEVFVPQGTQLWVCAALSPPKGPMIYSASLERAPLNARGAGEVIFAGLRLALRRGVPVTRPARRAAGE